MIQLSFENLGLLQVKNAPIKYKNKIIGNLLTEVLSDYRFYLSPNEELWAQRLLEHFSTTGFLSQRQMTVFTDIFKNFDVSDETAKKVFE